MDLRAGFLRYSNLKRKCFEWDFAISKTNNNQFGIISHELEWDAIQFRGTDPPGKLLKPHSSTCLFQSLLRQHRESASTSILFVQIIVKYTLHKIRLLFIVPLNIYRLIYVYMGIST